MGMIKYPLRATAGQIVKNCPCKGCKKRKVNCHAKCSDYKEYKKKTEEIRKKINKDNSVIGILNNNVYKAILYREAAMKNTKKMQGVCSTIRNIRANKRRGK